jgi:quinol monooxygenase YgiN
MEETLMHRHVVIAVFILAALLGSSPITLAQDAAPKNIYAITYIEVTPASAPAARKLILDHSMDVKKASGAVQIEAFQRIGYPNHFALIEQWQSAAAKQTYASSDSATKFRNTLGPLQSAAYDERIHSALSVGPSKPASSDSVVLVTHVDVVPTATAAGSGSVKAFVELGRGTTGNCRFDALTQSSRQNHMSVVECWDAQAQKDAWISTAAARSFREGLHPMSGSLYDERVYKLLR